MAKDPNRYSSLSLDEIYAVTATDAAHAGDMHDQSRGLQALCDKLGASLDSIMSSRSSVSGKFEGAAAGTMFDKLNDLVHKGTRGHAEISSNPGIFQNLAEQSRRTHHRIEEIRDERDHWLDRVAADPHDPKAIARFGAANPARLHHNIRHHFDVEARDYMRSATEGYVQSVKNLGHLPPYDGPRIPREGESNVLHGFTSHTTPGPTVDHVLGEMHGSAHASVGMNDPKLQSGPNTLPPPLHEPVHPGPQNGSNSMLGGLPSLTAGSGGKNRKAKRRKNTKTETVTYESDRSVTPPVIGARDNASVYGQQPEAAPAHTGDGLLPPVLGGRMGPARAIGTPAPRVPAPPSVTPRAAVPRSTFGNSGAGIRGVQHPTEHPAEGRVFRAGTGESRRPVARPFARVSKETHGDPDTPNRAVIRNSRALSAAPEPEPRREGSIVASPDPSWTPDRPVVPRVVGSRRSEPVEAEDLDHDPGPYLTNYNLGRHP